MICFVGLNVKTTGEMKPKQLPNKPHFLHEKRKISKNLCLKNLLLFYSNVHFMKLVFVWKFLKLEFQTKVTDSL